MVGAIKQGDQRLWYSNYGVCTDLFAPGTLINSTWIGSNSATYIESETSMAAPHVAGAMALFLEKHSGNKTQAENDLLAVQTDAVGDPGLSSPNLLTQVNHCEVPANKNSPTARPTRTENPS